MFPFYPLLPEVVTAAAPEYLLTLASFRKSIMEKNADMHHVIACYPYVSGRGCDPAPKDANYRGFLFVFPFFLCY